MNVLITGSSGFLGSNFTRSFKACGWDVTGLDLRSPVFTMPDSFVLGDVRDNALVSEALRTFKPDIILHLAAFSTVQQGLKAPSETWSVNYDGTKNILQSVKELLPDSFFVYASTDKVYGELLQAGGYTEDMPLSPLITSPYDCSKAEADKLVRSYDRAFILRFCNIYGPFDESRSRVVPSGIRAVLCGKSPVLKRYIDSEGDTKDFFRDMLFVGDLADTVRRFFALLMSGASFAGYSVFNLGTSAPVSMKNVLEEISKTLNFPEPPEEQIISGSDEIHLQSMNCSRAKKYLGFSPTTSLEDGIKETVKWLKGHR